MHLLITGSNGQLGRALQTAYGNGSADRITLWDRPEVDITDPATSRQVMALAPDVVINAAAWTDVDGAQRHEDAAYAANVLGPAYLAEGCERCGALLMQISTNEVFPGLPGKCYREYDQTGATSVYASTKLAGEVAVRQLARRVIIARIAWLFGPGGNNFPTKIVAAADKHGALRVVSDEVSNPTYAPDAANAMAALITLDRPGAYHLTNEGSASRFEFAKLVLQAAGRGHIPLTPIPAGDWPRLAPPPLHAVLVNQAAAALGIRLRPWQEAVEEYGVTLAAPVVG